MTPLHVAFLRGHRDFVAHLLQRDEALVLDVTHIIARSSAERTHWNESQWRNFCSVLRGLASEHAAVRDLLLDAVVSMMVESGQALMAEQTNTAATKAKGADSTAALDMDMQPSVSNDGFLTLVDNYILLQRCAAAGASDEFAHASDPALEPLWESLDVALSKLESEHADAISASERDRAVDMQSNTANAPNSAPTNVEPSEMQKRSSTRTCDCV